MRAIEPFEQFFERATGCPPYAYQRELGERATPPAVLEVPTGAGKTQALLVSWLYARRVRATGPRRLVYALPMRTLVEQTTRVAESIRESLELDGGDLAISTLMGGAADGELRDWRNWPERDAILIGTIDMLLSRALNRGYAESRFAWPISFALLNNDCRWVFDEIQLMGSARATSAQLDGLRAVLGCLLPCETVWTSATVDLEALETVDRPQLGDVVSLSAEDRSGALHGRLHARKTLERVDLSESAEREFAKRIASAARERHAPATRTLVVLNTVELAQAVYLDLTENAQAETVLLHSRFRAPERERHMDTVLAAPGDTGTIVVATQVVEAGVDLSARTLITETAPFSSIVQRLGRCNREGEPEQATVIWLDRGPLGEGALARRRAAPYEPVDLELAREALLGLEGRSLSPATLEGVEKPKESADAPAVLRRGDLLDLFDTSPDLSGSDIDIAPFIREDDERSISVLFRDVADDETAVAQPLPARDELVHVPLGGLGNRACWTIDHLAGGWTRRPSREIPPGATVMLHARDGGYDVALGWYAKAKGPVPVSPPVDGPRPDATGADPETVAREPEELLPHLAHVAEHAEGLAARLGLRDWSDVLGCAGALHDLGKAHPVFQRTLRAAIRDARSPEQTVGEAESPTAPDANHARQPTSALTEKKISACEATETEDDRIWAKSPNPNGRRHGRPFFRHELASTLAILGLDGTTPEIPRRNLTAYLVAAHHGKVRLAIRPAPGEQRPRETPVGARFALGIVDGDELPEVQTPIGAIPAVKLDLAPMELGAERSWTDIALGLRGDPGLGPFRLSFLEALLRIADWRATGA